MLDRLLNPMVVQFYEIIVLTENIDHLPHRILRFALLSMQDQLRNPTLHASGETDETLGMLGQSLEVCSGSVIKTVDVSIRNDLGKVTVSFIVFCQQPEVVGFVVFPTGLLVILVIGDEVTLTTNDWLDAMFLRLLNEGNGPEKIPVISQSHG